MTTGENTTNGSANGNQIDLFFTPSEVSEERLKIYNVVVVDVLRAGTSIATALSNGARGVFPVRSIAEATALAAQLSRDNVLLCGEREGRMIDGFNLGNSPADYSRDRVRGRDLIFGSTNGSPAVVKASGARCVYLCGFVNLNAVIDALLKLKNPYPLAIVCAGKLSRFSIEDAVCSGKLIERLQERSDTKTFLNDGARTALLLAREFGSDVLKLLRESDHGRYLIEIGMENDLPLSAADSVLPVVPALRDGKLVKLTK